MKKSNNKIDNNLTPLQAKVAIKIAGKIAEQETWIKSQESQVLDAILGDSKTGYDLRQMVQALNTGKMTQQALTNHFVELVGITYEDYTKLDDKAVKIVSPEEKLLQAISNLIDSKLAKNE